MPGSSSPTRGSPAPTRPGSPGRAATARRCGWPGPTWCGRWSRSWRPGWRRRWSRPASTTACRSLRDATGLETAALSGGVFQNLLLLERTVASLERAGFRVLVHSRVPPNDGGISLGQAAVAGARDRARG